MRERVWKHVEFVLRTNGAGGQTAEVAFASGSAPPNKAAVTLTKLMADGTLTDLTSGAVKICRNTAAFTSTIAADVYLYAGIRTAMATTQPTLMGVVGDFGQGFILTTAAAGALTGTGPWTGALSTVSASATAPELIGVLD